MQASPRVVLPYLVYSPCKYTRDEVHIVEYKVSKKEAWCIQCGRVLDWYDCVDSILENALKFVEDMQYKDE